MILVLLFILLLVSVVGAILVFHVRSLDKAIQSKDGELAKLKNIHNGELEKVKRTLENTEKALSDTSKNFGHEMYESLIVSHMDQGVICVDASGVIRYMNSYAQRFVDFIAVLGKPYKDVIHMRSSGDVAGTTILDRAFSGASQELPAGFELVSQHGTFPIVGKAIPLIKNNTVDAVALIFSDNTSEIARMKDEQAFFSAAAHELRTPLTTIRLTVSLLKDTFDSLGREKIQENLRRMEETSEQLVKLVNDFLNISRIDQGRIDMKHESFDIVRLTDDVITDLALLAKQKNLYIHHEPGESDHRAVMGDLTKAKEVLVNLLTNGLKYTVQGGITITHHEVNGKLATDVADTGGGIPLESQGLLFKRFGQIGAARESSSAKSTGLGLYISKKFAQLMGGDIVLSHSEPGQGSVFSFILPLS